jgi:very-short-patch-repair endonuclease
LIKGGNSVVVIDWHGAMFGVPTAPFNQRGQLAQRAGDLQEAQYMKPYRRDLKLLSRKLRSDSTDAERVLWQKLRSRQMRGLQFYRQKPLLDYIVDFYCPRARLVVEIDGMQHLEVANVERDAIRDNQLVSIGLKVLRFSNLQVLQETEAALAAIDLAIQRSGI